MFGLCFFEAGYVKALFFIENIDYFRMGGLLCNTNLKSTMFLMLEVKLWGCVDLFNVFSPACSRVNEL